MILAWAFLASCSSTPPLTSKKDEFFKPLDRKPKPEQRVPDAQSQIEVLRAELKILRDSLGRMLNYTLYLLQETHEQRDRIRALEDTLVSADIRARGIRKKFETWMADSLKKAADLSKIKVVYIDGRIVLYSGFDTGKVSMKPEFQRTIDKVYELMRMNQNLQIRIEAYTDDVGEAGANQRLSEERARAVMNALVRNGIDPKRLTALGLGSSRPIVANTSTDERARSNRVELVRR